MSNKKPRLVSAIIVDMTIEKKAWPEYFEQIIRGDKTFDLRLGDFEISQGDTLLLREWNPKTQEYTGREVSRTVGYVGTWSLDELTKFWPREEVEKHGLQVISLKSLQSN